MSCRLCGGCGEVSRVVTRNEWGVWDRDTVPCPACMPYDAREGGKER